MANIIHARSKGEGEFNPTSKTLCFRCMEHGDHYVFIRGSRKYACTKHFREWMDACNKSERDRDKILSEEA